MRYGEGYVGREGKIRQQVEKGGYLRYEQGGAPGREADRPCGMPPTPPTPPAPPARLTAVVSTIPCSAPLRCEKVTDAPEHAPSSAKARIHCSKVAADSANTCHVMKRAHCSEAVADSANAKEGRCEKL